MPLIGLEVVAGGGVVFIGTAPRSGTQVQASGFLQIDKVGPVKLYGSIDSTRYSLASRTCPLIQPQVLHLLHRFLLNMDTQLKYSI